MENTENRAQNKQKTAQMEKDEIEKSCRNEKIINQVQKEKSAIWREIKNEREIKKLSEKLKNEREKKKKNRA